MFIIPLMMTQAIKARMKPLRELAKADLAKLRAFGKAPETIYDSPAIVIPKRKATVSNAPVKYWKIFEMPTRR
jgi:hypothetical protein